VDPGSEMSGRFEAAQKLKKTANDDSGPINFFADDSGPMKSISLLKLTI
jgi:hypothetical protein